MKIITMLFFLMLSVFISTASEPMKVYYFPRPPYYIVNADGSVSGLITDVVKKVFDDAGVKYTFIEAPSRRVEESLKLGENACGIGWFKRPDREEFAVFSDPIYQDKKQNIIILTSKRNSLPANPTLEQILKSPLKLGVIDGFSYGSWVDDAIKKFNPSIEKANVDQTRFLLMNSNARFDYGFISQEEGEYSLNSDRNLSSKLSLVPISDAPSGNYRYIMYSKGVNNELIRKVNASIKKIVKF